MDWRMKITGADIITALESGESEARSGSYRPQDGAAPAIKEAMLSSKVATRLLFGEGVKGLTEAGCSPHAAVLYLLTQYTVGVEHGIAIAEARQLSGVPVESR